MQVVYVHSDRDQKSFTEYHQTMPWNAIPFVDGKITEALTKKLDVQEIPSLVVLGADGQVVCQDGRAAGLSKESIESWLEQSKCGGSGWVSNKVLNEVTSTTNQTS